MLYCVSPILPIECEIQDRGPIHLLKAAKYLYRVLRLASAPPVFVRPRVWALSNSVQALFGFVQFVAELCELFSAEKLRCGSVQFEVLGVVHIASRNDYWLYYSTLASITALCFVFGLYYAVWTCKISFELKRVCSYKLRMFI